MPLDEKVIYLSSRIFNSKDEEEQADVCQKYKIKLTKYGQINRQSNLGKALQSKLNDLQSKEDGLDLHDEEIQI